MKSLILLNLVLVTTLGLGQTPQLYDLTSEHLTNPVGIETQQPRLSWKIKSTERNTVQTGYSIRVATSPSFSQKDIFWTSGKQMSDKSNLVAYSGPKLESMQRYFWQVKIWDNQQKASSWSSPAYWEMGILNPEDWEATWIEPVQDSLPNGPASLVRKTFSISKKVKRARAYTTAKGLYELHLNGKKVGDQLFTPGWTTYNERLQYQVYDLTDLLNKGENAVGTLIGDGWYKGALGWGDQWGVYGKKVAFLCQLVIEYDDGTQETMGTDDSWKSTAEGPITMNSIYHGEHYDARLEMTGWDLPDYNDDKWKPVTVNNEGVDQLVPSISVPVKRIQEIQPVGIWTTPNGTVVADMGQNMVGWVRLKASGPAGTTVTLRHAEVLDKYGEFYTENLRAAEATVKYTLKGKGSETYEPTFTFMGFRYVAVEGFPGELTPENLTGIVIHSDMDPTGTFSCSDSLVNRLQKNILWGQKGNFLDVPTDCPQRDERMGWTGDAQAFIRTAAFNMDVAAFFTKWLRDLEAEQAESGAVPFVIPNVLGEVRASAGWADVATIAPWTLYEVYGDKRLLTRQYPSMKKYVDFIRKDAGENYLWKDGSVFGDWLFFKPELSLWRVPDGHTDQDFIATAFYAYSTSLLIKSAQVLGMEEDVQTYSALLEKIKMAFNENYVTPAGRTVSNSQTSYVLALMFDLLPEKKRQNAIKYLVENIEERGTHLSTGFLGTPYLCHVLSRYGETETAYDLLLQQSFPSWLYPIKMGATTIWERWDGLKPDSTFQNAGMNSFNHYAYGAIGDWMYQVIAGLQIGEIGYKHIVIRPEPDPRLSFARATYESRYGQIKSGWEMKGGKMIVKITIPPNTTAIITLPGAVKNQVTEGSKPLSGAFKSISERDGNVLLDAGSGSYVFEYPIKSPSN